MKTVTKLGIGLGILAALSPIGLFLPDKLKAGAAWGEWSSDEIDGLIGYVPGGLEKLSSLWKSVMPDYAFKGWDGKGLGHLSIAYIVSALVGIALCIGCAWLLGKLLARKEKWLLRKKGPLKKAGGFIDRTLLGVVSLLKETISNDQLASKKGFLQQWDPRFKCLSIAVMLVCILSARSVAALTLFYAMTLVLSVISGISLQFFLKRTLLFIPIFSLFIVVPAIFNVVTPGESVISLKLFSHILSITRQGIDSAVIFFMRVLTSVSIATLLMLTTRHHVLLKVLRIFKVPQIFVMTMGMTYRYIYLLLDMVQNTFTAIRSRVGFVTSTKTGRRIVALNMAGLWLKSYRLQTQVYSAMLARGYTGEPQVLDDFRAHTMDFVVLASAILCFMGTLWLNRFIN